MALYLGEYGQHPIEQKHITGHAFVAKVLVQQGQHLERRKKSVNKNIENGGSCSGIVQYILCYHVDCI